MAMQLEAAEAAVARPAIARVAWVAAGMRRGGQPCRDARAITGMNSDQTSSHITDVATLVRVT